MPFYKMQEGQHEFTFQLADLNVREDFSIWDNTNKIFLRQVEGVNDINDLKFMQRDLFAQRYPNFRKVSQYIRELIITLNDTPTLYSFGFKKSANDQIVDEIRNRQQLGKDPLDYTFKYRKTGSGLATTHVVVLMNEIGKPQGVLQPNLSPQPQQRELTPSLPQKPLESPVWSPQAKSSGQIRLEGVSGSGLGLTPQEQVIVDLFNSDNQMYSEDLFVQVFKNTMITHHRQMPDVQRVKLIYREHYQKQLPSKS